MQSTYRQKIDILFEQRCFSLLPEQIINMNKALNSGDFNNVIVGLRKQFLSIVVDKELSNKNFQLVYINGTTTLQGHTIKLNIDDEERDGLTFIYSRYLAFHHPELDVIDTFNTFQMQVRSFIEKLGYMSIDSNTLASFNNPVFTLIKKKGLYNVTMIDKVSFYKSFFGDNKLRERLDSEKYIYLILNTRNNRFKIGSSKNAAYREKTLQAQEPEIKMITYWCGPVSIEKKLHKHFHDKRQRGEWFKLDFYDLESIHGLVTSYLLSK